MTTTIDLQARMTNPAIALEGALPALQAIHKVIVESGLSPRTTELVNLRVSQINGCGVCAVQHPRIARRHGETDERLFAVAAWRDAPFFTAAERAALDLAEHVTRIADTGDPVPDAVWDAAAAEYDEPQLAALLLCIAQINTWNRLNVATRQVAGQAW
jgi:AhpD family alkylhydroperoxidase